MLITDIIISLGNEFSLSLIHISCKAAVVIEGNEIYIPISQAQDLCREIGEPSEISKVYLKINGKNNLELSLIHIWKTHSIQWKYRWIIS